MAMCEASLPRTAGMQTACGEVTLPSVTQGLATLAIVATEIVLEGVWIPTHPHDPLKKKRVHFSHMGLLSKHSGLEQRPHKNDIQSHLNPQSHCGRISCSALQPCPACSWQEAYLDR